MLDQRGKVVAAVMASLGLHILLFFFWALAVQFLARPSPTPAPPPKPIKLTLETEKPEPTPTPVSIASPPPIRFADTGDMREVATPPPDAKRVSARNTVDSSELPPTGSEANPAQEGRKIPTFVLNTVEAPQGAEPPPPESTKAATPAPQTAPPLPRAVPQATAPPPAPASTPSRSADFALATPASLPTEPTVEPNPFDPAFRPPANLTAPPRPTPVPRRETYHPQPLKTFSSGNISNVGSASVASVATPTGRYQAVIKAAVQRRWNTYIESRMDVMTVGTVTVRFLVGMDGKARGVQVTSNTANEALASISLRAIMEAGIPPMPADAVPATGGGQLPMDLTFELLDQAR